MSCQVTAKELWHVHLDDAKRLLMAQKALLPPYLYLETRVTKRVMVSNPSSGESRMLISDSSLSYPKETTSDDRPASAIHTNLRSCTTHVLFCDEASIRLEAVSKIACICTSALKAPGRVYCAVLTAARPRGLWGYLHCISESKA